MSPCLSSPTRDVPLVHCVLPGAQGPRPPLLGGTGDQHSDAGAGRHAEEDRAHLPGEGHGGPPPPLLILLHSGLQSWLATAPRPTS